MQKKHIKSGHVLPYTELTDMNAKPKGLVTYPVQSNRKPDFIISLLLTCFSSRTLVL